MEVWRLQELGLLSYKLKRSREPRMSETQFSQLQTFHVRIDEPHRVLGADIVIKDFRKQGGLCTVRWTDKIHVIPDY